MYMIVQWYVTSDRRLNGIKAARELCHHRVRVITRTTPAQRPGKLQPTTRLSVGRPAVCESSNTCTPSHTTQLSRQRYRRVCSGRVDFEIRPHPSILTTWRQRATTTTTTTTTSAQRRQQQNRSNNSTVNNLWTFIDSGHTLLSWISRDLGGRGFEEQG